MQYEFLNIGLGLVILILQGQHKPTERCIKDVAKPNPRMSVRILKHLSLLEDLWLTYAPTSGMPYLQHLGLDGGQEGN